MIGIVDPFRIATVTAKIGIEVPTSLLLGADEVIE